METALLIDFGSTYTKVTAVDVRGEVILAASQALTTVDTDITEGLNQALSKLEEQGVKGPFEHKLACSSAAGGLRMIAIGLVPELTLEAARQAALGAGARVLKVYARFLTEEDGEEIAGLKPDILLLAGGTDGGNKEAVLHNAGVLAQSSITAPIVYAGNRNAAKDAKALLEAADKAVVVTQNVMPELNTLNIEPARQVIREIFLEQITRAKGLNKAEVYVERVLMPTPSAVLQAAKLLAQGTADERGLGDLLLVDVGGATTDVHSMARGFPGKAGVTLKGLPEPYAKRTVEGDLGMRCSALSLLEKTMEKGLVSAERCGQLADRIAGEPGWLAASSEELEGELALARGAVTLAVERHAGRLEVIYTPFGASWVQYGKDLTGVKTLIGTGGVLVRNRTRALDLLQGALFNEAEPQNLKPQNPSIYLDYNYSLAAMGLLAEFAPDAALRITKNNLYLLQEGLCNKNTEQNSLETIS